MNREPIRDITDEEVSRFWMDGVICCEGLFGWEWVERMRVAVDEDLANPGPQSREYEKPGGVGRFLGDIGIWWIKPELRAYVMDSPAASIAQRFLGSEKVNFFYDQLFVKEPGTVAATPWHQDQPYWPIKGWQVLSIWLALDDVTLETSGVEYVKGSHRASVWYKPRNFGGDPNAYRNTPGIPIPDFDAERDRHTFLSWDMKAGDCLVHHALTVHGARGNPSPTQRRRAYATRWCGDDVTYDPRPDLVPLTLAEIPLEPGDELDCAIFPRVWPREGSRPL